VPIILSIHYHPIYQTIGLSVDFIRALNVYFPWLFNHIFLYCLLNSKKSFTAGFIVSKMGLTVEGIVWQSKEVSGRILFSRNSFIMEDLQWKIDLFIYFIRWGKKIFTFDVILTIFRPISSSIEILSNYRRYSSMNCWLLESTEHACFYHLPLLLSLNAWDMYSQWHCMCSLTMMLFLSVDLFSFRPCDAAFLSGVAFRQELMEALR